MSKNKKGKVVSLKPAQLSPVNYIKTQARSLPIFECLISEDWESQGICSIIVSRRHKSGNFTVGIFLVDLYCLGVKDAHYEFNIDQEEYEYLINNGGPLEARDYALVHNIIYGATAYAEDFGFKPHSAFGVAQYILEEDDDDIPLMEIEFGFNGQPCYMTGPDDDEAKIKSITAILNRTAGPGNFEVVDIGGVASDDEDFEEDDFDGEDWDEDDDLDEDWNDALGIADNMEERSALHQKLLKKINKAYDIVVRGKDPKAYVVTTDIGTAYKVTEGNVKNEYTTFDNDGQEAEYNRIREMLIDGEYDKGIKLAKKAIEKYPHKVGFHDMLLSAYNVIGELDKAEQAVREIYRLFPSVLMARVSFANVLLTDERAAEGLALFDGKKDLNELYPDRKLFYANEAAEYYACMCRLYVALGDFDNADLYMDGIFNKKLLKKAPNSFVGHAIREMLAAKFKIIQEQGSQSGEGE